MLNKLTLIGTGNVAFHFCKLFSELDFEIQVVARNKSDFSDFQKQFQVIPTQIEKLRNELVLICVKDVDVSETVAKLDDSNKIAYTSGAVALTTLPKKSNLGVFYPLQSFSKSRKLDYFNIPFLIEANNEYFAQELFDLAWKVSKKVEFADSSKRKKIHLAAVFANNFTNHLLNLAKNQLGKENIDFALLEPLIEETFKKAIDLSPETAQTGPARRNDRNTIEEQENALTGIEKQVYHDLTTSILAQFGHEKL